MTMSAASKNVRPAKGNGGVVGVIMQPKKPVNNFPLMSYLANNCTFLDDEDASQETEEGLKAANNKRVEEMLNEAAAMKIQSQTTDLDDEERKKALELIQSLEWSRNQEDTWKVTKPQSKNEPEYRHFLHPIQRCEDDYFSGTRKFLKRSKERKRSRSDELRLLDNGKLVFKNGSDDSTEVAQLPINLKLPMKSKSPRVPSVGLPFTPGPPPSITNNAWFQGSGSALFSDVQNVTVVADGVEAFNEQMALAIAESLRTSTEEQQRYVNLNARHEFDTLSLPKCNDEPFVRCPPDPPGTVWEDDDSTAVTQLAETAGVQMSSIGYKEKQKEIATFYPCFNRIEKYVGNNHNSQCNSSASLDQRSKFSPENENSSKSPPPPVNFEGMVHTVSDYSSEGKIVTLKIGAPLRNLENSRPRSQHQNSNEDRIGDEVPKVDESPILSQCTESSSTKILEEQTNIESSCSQSRTNPVKRIPSKSTHVPETFSINPRFLKQAVDNKQHSEMPVREHLSVDKPNQDAPLGEYLSKATTVRVQDDNLNDTSAPTNVSVDFDEPCMRAARANKYATTISNKQVEESFLPDAHGSLPKEKPPQLQISRPALVTAMKTFHRSTAGNDGRSGLKTLTNPSDQPVNGHQHKEEESYYGSMSQAERPCLPIQESVKFMKQQATGIDSSNPSVTNVTHCAPCPSQITASVSSPTKLDQQLPCPVLAPNETRDNLTDLAAGMAAQMQLNQWHLMQQTSGFMQPSILQNQNKVGLNTHPNQFLNEDNLTKQGQTVAASVNNSMPVIPGAGNNLPAGLPNIASIPGLPNNPLLGVIPGGVPGHSDLLQGLGNFMQFPFVFQAGFHDLPSTQPAGVNRFSSTVPGGFASGFAYGSPYGVLGPYYTNTQPMTTPGLPGWNTNAGGYCTSLSTSELQQNSLASMQELRSNVPVGYPKSFLPSEKTGSFSQSGSTPLLAGKGRGRLTRTAPP